MVLAGESLRGIAISLTERGVPTASGGTWRGGNLNQLLRQPRLAGLREYEGELIASDGLIEPILGVDDWKRLREMLSDPARNLAQSRAAKHLLTGLLRCGNCGGRLIGSSTRGRRTYRCHGVSVPGACGKVSIDAAKLEAVIGDSWIEALDGRELPAQVKALTSDHREVAEQVNTYRDRLADATQAHFVRGELTKPEYADVRRKLQALISQGVATIRRDQETEKLAGLVGHAQKTWSGSTTSQRRQLLPLLFDHITIAPLTGKGRFDPARALVTFRT